MNPNRRNIAGYYNKMQLETASQNKQITMLHSRMQSLIERALLPETSSAQKRLNLNKVQNIISQLQIALQTDEEDELIAQLFHLYEYLYNKCESEDEKDWQDGLEIAETLTDTFKKLLNRK